MSLGTTLIFGGSGSFGRAFIQHALSHRYADRIYSVSRNSTLRYDLRRAIPDKKLAVLAGDVTDPRDLELLPQGIDTVILAAAEKHIGTGEDNPYWVDKINVGGAKNVIAWAADRGVSRVVALSTDKACNPVNAYGRSKAEAERLFRQASAWFPKTRFAVVRYGNVVASSGSVLPLFLEQRAGGVLTVTDKRMTRYFMPLSPESAWQVIQEPAGRPVMSAVGLVLYALEHMTSGETFIPHIPSGSIYDLAQQVGPECRIEEVGIRPGEKLHEELIAAEESERCWRTEDGVYVLTTHAVDVPRRGDARVPAGFTYASSDDPQRLTLEWRSAEAAA